jgi:hypothetical protein
MGPHLVVMMYSPVRLDIYGVNSLIEVETLSVELLFVSIDHKEAHIKLSLHYQLLLPTFNNPLLLSQ